MSHYVEGGDTLLFAFNYGDQEGYMVVSADLSRFPIVAKADAGSVDFEDMDSADPFSAYVANLAADIRESLASDDRDTAYANLWADILNPEYEYVVTMPEEEAAQEGANKAARTPTGRATISPHISIALSSWKQSGLYNSEAGSGAIGCPAMAIGMLLYDVGNRGDLGIIATNPKFDYSDQYTSKNTPHDENIQSHLPVGNSCSLPRRLL